MLGFHISCAACQMSEQCRQDPPSTWASLISATNMQSPSEGRYLTPRSSSLLRSCSKAFIVRVAALGRSRSVSSSCKIVPRLPWLTATAALHSQNFVVVWMPATCYIVQAGRSDCNSRLAPTQHGINSVATARMQALMHLITARSPHGHMRSTASQNSSRLVLISASQLNAMLQQAKRACSKYVGVSTT